MGFPQQQNPGFPTQPQQPPQFSQPYNLGQQGQQAPSQGFVTQDQLSAALDQINGLNNQIAALTGAVNGLGQNQEALHQWLVAQAQNIAGMISSIANSIKTEGALGFLRGMLSGGAPQPVAPPAPPVQPQLQQFAPQGFPPPPQ